MQRKTIYVFVSSDLVTDNRVAKTCEELHILGHRVILVGRRKKKSPEMTERPYQTMRLKTYIEKGALFYASLNLRLFFLLLFRRVDGVYANDLDTLLPAYLISRIKKIPLIYDSHELFTEVPELIERPKIRSIWLRIEKSIFPKLTHIITVNKSIASIYEKIYGKDITVVRNVPKIYTSQNASRKALGLPEDKFIVIIQGSGLNIGRGIEEAVKAMIGLENVLLLIVGDGDAIPASKEIVQKNKLENQVIYVSRVPYLSMMQYTEIADLGLSLDKPIGLNYAFSLPNKIFDYLHASTPILCTNLQEVARVVHTHQCGIVLPELSIENLRSEIQKLTLNKPELDIMKNNCLTAAQKENWEIEKIALISLIQRAFS